MTHCDSEPYMKQGDHTTSGYVYSQVPGVFALSAAPNQEPESNVEASAKFYRDAQNSLTNHPGRLPDGAPLHRTTDTFPNRDVSEPECDRRFGSLDRQVTACEAELRRLGADHPYVSLLQTIPGIAWVLGYTIAAEIGEVERFPSPKKLCGYTGLCPSVNQSGQRDFRGPLSKNGPKFLRWALIEAATHAARHPLYRERYERTQRRLGRQRGAKVARVEIARKLSEAIWHMLTRNEPFAPAGATASPLAA